MGLFDKLLKSGMRAVGDAVADAVSEAVSEAVRDKTGTSNWRDNHTQSAENVYQPVQTAADEDKDWRSFDEKLQSILPELGDYEVRRNVSPDELEQEAGHEIYSRLTNCKSPDNFTYVLYQNGARVLIINLWDDYTIYTHKANRDIHYYCVGNGIKMLDFFDYLPNRADYMRERIRTQL